MDKTDPDHIPLWSKEIKARTTPAQSLTYVDPEKNYFPKPFAINKRPNCLVGITIPISGAYIQRMGMHDTGTVSRPYRAHTRKEVEVYISTMLNNNFYHTSLESLVEEALAIGKRGLSNQNEVMARIQWLENDDAYQVMIFTDNIGSRLLAQSRAYDIHEAVVKRRQREGKEASGNYYPKISFYPSFKEYSLEEQKNDLIKTGLDRSTPWPSEDLMMITNPTSKRLGQFLHSLDKAKWPDFIASDYAHGVMNEAFLQWKSIEIMLDQIPSNERDELIHALKVHYPPTRWNRGHFLLDYAVVMKDLVLVKDILAEGKINLGASSRNGDRPLALAVMQGSTEIVKCLLAYEAYEGVFINLYTVENEHILCYAVKQGYIEIAHALLDTGKEIDPMMKQHASQKLAHLSAPNSKPESVPKLAPVSAPVSASGWSMISSATTNKPLRFTAEVAAVDVRSHIISSFNKH
ncbi:MAG: ankyrin repeat domain-containing protein [Gammaproteobacteria bacterium]